MASKASPIPPQPGATAYAIAVLSLVVGAGSLIVFGIFLFFGPFRVVHLGFGQAEALAFNGFLCAAFFVQHSGMIRKAARQRMSKVIAEQRLGALFSIASGITLLALVLLWQETASMVASAQGPYRWLLRVVFFLSVAVQVWGILALRSADLFGIDSVLRGGVETTAPMVVRGPYRWVRHPLYLTSLLMIWSYPDLTTDRLLFNGLFTVWIVVGAVLEERDLVLEYGQAYRSYQHRVPMLIPYRRPMTDR